VIRVSSKKLVVTKIQGVNFRYRPDTTDSHTIREVFKDKSYRKVKVGFDVLPGERWLDLGANIGVFALYCHLAGARVTCYEPDEDNYTLLQRNCPWADCHMAAVTEHNCHEVDLYHNGDPSNTARHTVMRVRGYKHSRLVPNVWAGLLQGGWDGVKMDIEGSELGIIDADLIPPCNKLVLEYHHSRDKSLANFARRLSRLRDQFHTVCYRAELDRMMQDGVGCPMLDRMMFCIGRRVT